MNGEEVRDLAISTAALGAAVAVLFFGDSRPGFLLDPAFLPAVAAATGLAAVSFIPHAMSHRVSARAIKSYAEYRMWTPGVIIAVLSSFLGVVFAAPGGIEMHTRKGERYGHWEPELTVKQVGLVAVLGPLMNVMLGVIFAFLGDVSAVTFQGKNLLVLGTHMNAFLAAFTLLPFYPLDGYKVMRWSTPLWLFVLVLSGLLFFL
ncbi:MAG: metalloprotease [Candidatus Nanohaloarchaea archaeon]|nr:metalloprotease [Candidatus Nanohaloarchaea archaeon]